jgi:two-component system, LytTR family, response regulator
MIELTVVIADDERPAREYLKTLLADDSTARLVGEAENGADALELIKTVKPDLALLDLNMPVISGLDVVRRLTKTQMPLVAFVTAHDEFAIAAFEVNAIDYLLKPVEPDRLTDTIRRAHERLEHADWRTVEADRVVRAAAEYDERGPKTLLERIPVKVKDEIQLVNVVDIASVVADGELLHLTTSTNARYTINHRLKDLEARLDPAHFFRLSRGAIVNLQHIDSISPLPGGTYVICLTNGQQIPSSRSHSRSLRSHLLKI